MRFEKNDRARKRKKKWQAINLERSIVNNTRFSFSFLLAFSIYLHPFFASWSNFLNTLYDRVCVQFFFYFRFRFIQWLQFHNFFRVMAVAVVLILPVLNVIDVTVHRIECKRRPQWYRRYYIEFGVAAIVFYFEPSGSLFSLPLIICGDFIFLFMMLSFSFGLFV